MEELCFCRFPNESGLRLLLACGGRWLDLDAVESSGNTPLHIICQRNKDPEIIKLLLRCGSHVDCVNKNGKTPFDYLNGEQIKALFPTRASPARLKCLCARILVHKSFNTDTSNALTSTLKKFVLLHDCSRAEYGSTKRKV